jgi:tetratricopeptide (TPR) repeat protein
VELARVSAAADRTPEWQALLDLGFLWASRDYAQSRDYYQQSLELARQAGDRTALAHSLNRLGNWHLNVEQPLEALRCHREALSIFQALNNRPGLAETFDLLGMASYLSADLIGGTDYYRQAVALFREWTIARALLLVWER